MIGGGNIGSIKDSMMVVVVGGGGGCMVFFLVCLELLGREGWGFEVLGGLFCFGWLAWFCFFLHVIAETCL